METFIANFHFLRPLFLLALIPVAVIFFLMLQGRRKSSNWTSLIDAKLLPYLIDGTITKAQKFPLYCLVVLWILSCFALAGPTWEKRPLPIQKDLSAMVILWDMSPSMVAKDLEPSRLVRSRLKLVDLLNARKEGLTALIVYAGDAHVVTPLTDDTKTIKSLLPGLAPNVLPQAGSNPELAFEMAHTLLKDAGIVKGNIVFATDGIVDSALSELKSIAAQSRHKVTIWGFGTRDGAPIPLANGGFARNKQGEIVVAKLDHDSLSDAAVALDGVYIPYTNNNNDVENIQVFGLGDYSKQNSEDAKISEQWLEQGYWIVLLLLPFAALLFRRGWLFCLAFGVFLTPETQALSWSDLWKNDNQQARRLLDEDAKAAAEKFKDPQWKAVAKFKAGDYGEAATLFDNFDDAQGHYNRGNALTHEGSYDEAIAAYDRALEVSPDFEDAKHNRTIAEQLKQLQEQQQEQQQNQDQENQDQQSQDGDKSQQNQGQQDGQQQDGQQGQGEQDQQQKNDQAQSGEQKQDQQQPGQEGENSDSEKQEGGEPSDAQQKALEEHYKQNQPADDGEDGDQEQQQLQQAQPQEGEQAGEEQQVGVNATMSDEELEQQQALDQWLRKVPDDPSGLLRNKFKYENQVRRRKSTSRFPADPDATDDQRW